MSAKRMTDEAVAAARREADLAMDLDCDCDPHAHEDGCFEHEAATAINSLVADHDRARASEAEKDATIKALADALKSVLLDDGSGKTLRPETVQTIRDALRLAGRLP